MGSVLDKKKVLSDKELLFCHLYVSENFSGLAAARKTGFQCASEAALGVQVSKMLKKPKIKAKIESLMESTFEESNIKAINILRELAILAFSDMNDYVETDPNTRMIRIRSQDEMGLKSKGIRKLKIKQVSAITGDPVSDLGTTREPVSTEIEIQLWDKIKPLELLMKYKRMIVDAEIGGRTGGAVSPTKLADLSKLSDTELNKLIELHEKIEMQPGETPSPGKKG